MRHLPFVMGVLIFMGCSNEPTIPKSELLTEIKGELQWEDTKKIREVVKYSLLDGDTEIFHVDYSTVVINEPVETICLGDYGHCIDYCELMELIEED